MKTRKWALQIVTGILMLTTFANLEGGIEPGIIGKYNKSNGPSGSTQVQVDYDALSNWAAHPLMHTPADSVPAFLANETKDTSVDVFFLHPTTYTKKFNGWNADINDEAINKKTDEGTILFQASAFNRNCRIFAPRYRQAHLKAFFTKDTVAAAAALDFAYQDIKAAFQYYLDHSNHGRPIIIASHSQGTLHAIRLLQEFFDGKPLQKQLVCTYLVGYRIKKNAFKNIPFGTSPEATGCVVGWRSFKKGFVPPFVRKENGDCFCVNPVTWTTSNDWSPKDKHPGFVGKNFNQLVAPYGITAAITPGTQILWVDLPPRVKAKLLFVKNYHVGDYNLFYLNIRQNVKLRCEAYLKKNNQH